MNHSRNLFSWHLLFCFFCIASPLTAQDWIQLGNDIDGEVDNSGYSVSLSSDGSTVAIGAHGNDGNGTDAGHVQVYDWNGTMWVQRGSDIDGEAAGDWFGLSVSISADGNTVAGGAPLNDGNGTDAGHVRVYDWNDTIWAQRGNDIDGEAANDDAGRSVSISSDGNTIAIGARFNDGNGTDAGHVRVYDWDGTNWVQRGTDIDGEAAGDNSGHSVSLASNGNTVAIGALNNDGNGSNAGHVRVYEWDGTNWLQRGTDIDGEVAGDISGLSVSLSSDGNSVAIGAPGNNGFVGQVRVYDWDGTNWVQRGSDIDGEAIADVSGRSVSLSSNGNIVAIGAELNDGNGTWSGHVRVYEWNNTMWVQRGSDIDGEAERDNSGFSVSLSSDGDTLAIGAPNNDPGGHVRVYLFGQSITCPSDTIVIYSSTTDTATLGSPDNIVLGSSDSLVVEDDNLNFNTGCNNDTIGCIQRHFIIINKGSGERDTICIQKITLIDTTDPVISCPADTTIDCTASIETMSTGSGTAVDDWELESIRYQDAVVPAACFMEDTIYRLWIATDLCGNTDSCIQVITRVDRIAPEPDSCPEPSVINCSPGTELPIVTPTYSDNCTYMEDIVVSTKIDTLGQDTEHTGDDTIRVTFYATDLCDNVDSSCVQVFICDPCTGLPDSDCDGVNDECDECDGGDDTIDNNGDGNPDCAHYPGFDQLADAWKCHEDNKVLICHNGKNTLCVSSNTVPFHLGHGDYLGSCNGVSCGEPVQGDILSLVNSTRSKIDQHSSHRNFAEINFLLYPNPATDEVTLIADRELTGEWDIEIYSVIGEMVHRWKDKKPYPKTQLNISHLENGYYYMVILSGGQKEVLPFYK